MKIEDIKIKEHRLDVVSDTITTIFLFWNIMGRLAKHDQDSYVKKSTFKRSDAEKILKIIRMILADYNSLDESDKAYLAISRKIHGNDILTDDDRVYFQKHLNEMTKAWNEYSTK